MSSQGPNLDEVNPYTGHQELSKLEADVLWEYVKLAKNVRTLLVRTRELGESPDQAMLGQSRAVETKMGLVMTLFKASLWGVINDKQQQDDVDPYRHDDFTV